MMIWVVDGTVKIRAEAWGSEYPAPGINYRKMKPRRTTLGKYVIYSVIPYRTKTWPLSRIPWGTPIMRSSDGEHVVYKTGKTAHPWENIDKLIPGLTPDLIKQYYYELYGKWEIPNSWVFNDFGVKAVRYYKDLNHDKKLDAGESLSGEMIHTTPDAEASTALGQDVHLQSSHGCIHIKPIDRNRFEAAGAYAKGTDLFIHTYEESIPKEFQ